MSLSLAPIVDAIASHAAASGYFESVNTHEPKNAPGTGLTASVWVQSIGPLPAASGLAETTARVECTLRFYLGMVTEPQDAIDLTVMSAVDALMDAYTGDFTLGGLIRNVDVLGQHGGALSARAGYLSVSGTLYRVFDLTIPCIVNDVWSQHE